MSVNFVPNSSGFVTCMARNSKGLNRTIAEVVIIELEDMYITSERHSLGEGQFVDSMECSVNKRKFYEELNWYKDGKFVDRLAYPGTIGLNYFVSNDLHVDECIMQVLIWV